MRFKYALLPFVLVACVSTKAPEGESAPKPDALEVKLPGEDFIVLGDFGTGNSDQRSVATAMFKYCQVKVCDFGVTTGDNFYPSGVKSVDDRQWYDKFEGIYGTLGFTFYPTLGNHDHDGNWTAQVAYRSQRWHMPSRYYKITTPKADLFAVDTEYFDQRQAKFLDEGLAKSTALWKIIYTHRPVFSSGMHGNTIELDKLMKPILARHKVDFYLAGHDHHLELIERAGTAHVISGAGGKLRSVKGGKDTLFARAELGFAHLDFENNQVTVSFVNRNLVTLYAKTYAKAADRGIIDCATNQTKC